MSLILIYLILKAPIIKNKGKIDKEGFVKNLPEGAYQSAEELNAAEMKFINHSRGLLQQKRNDPTAQMMSVKSMNNFYKLPNKSGYDYHDITGIKSKKGKIGDDFKKYIAHSINTGSESQKVIKCKALTECNQLTGKDCGYCGSSGKFTYGDSTGPKVDVCGQGQWSMTANHCQTVVERNLCSNVSSCAELSGEAAEKCGYCPTTGAIMALKRSGNKWVPKYSGDTCNYSGGLLKKEQCAAFAAEHPCITPYSNTGPHPEACLKKLWSNSGCSGAKPYEKTFSQLKSSIGSISVSELGQEFQQTYQDTNAQGDMAKVIGAYKNCHNTEPNIDPCNLQFYGSSLTNQTKLARERCAKKQWTEKGGTAQGQKSYDRLQEGFETKKQVLSMSKDEYAGKVSQMKQAADRQIMNQSDYDAKNKASLAIYGVPADKPGALRPGDYVKMGWTGNHPGNLYGYVIDKDTQTQKWRCLWVIREKNGQKEERKSTMKQAEQKEKYGWNGYKAIGSDMSKVGDETGAVFGSQLRVLARCKPGNSLCGNSCGELIMRLMDQFPRPQDCVVSQWTGYGECSRQCGGGQKTKTRKIVYPPMRGGIKCPELRHTLACNNIPCTNKNFKEADKVGVKGTRDKVNYVQIVLPGGYLHVQEVEVYDEYGVNVASKANGGKGSASSTGWHGHANKPIDGQKNSRAWWSGPGGAANSNHTLGGTGQWWRVALKDAENKKVHTLSKIIVYNRPDGGESRLNGAELILWQGPPYRDDWKKVSRYTLTGQRRQVFNLGNRVMKSCYIKDAAKGYTGYKHLYNGKYPRGGGRLGYHRQPGKTYTQAVDNCQKKCKKDVPGSQSFIVKSSNNWWKGRCWCMYGGKSDPTYNAGGYKAYEFTPRRGEKEVCNSKEFTFTQKKAIKDFEDDCKKEGGKVGDNRCVDSFFEPSYYYTQSKQGKSSYGGGGGGDLDWNQRWYGWSSRKWPIEKCAKKCLQNPKCNRFSFGKTNSYGGWGLGCRTSLGGYNQGYSPVTTDRYRANGWKWWGQSNFWGGQIYDKKESFIGKRKEGFKEGATGSKKRKGGAAFYRIGDFRDTGNRDLPHYKGRVAGYGVYGDAFKCSWKCKDYKYFGLQWWGQCFCGNNYGKYYEHTNSGKKQNYKHRHRWAWTYYGGWRNKVFRNNAYQKEGEGEWKDCAKYGNNCNIPDPKRYVMRFGKGKKWTEFRPKTKNEKCTFEGRWGVENPLGDKGSTFTGGNQNRPSKGEIKTPTECAQHLARRGAKRGWYGNWSRIPHGCFTYNHWWHKSRWGGWNNSKAAGKKCGQNRGWGNRWICVNDNNVGKDKYKAGKCQIKKLY